MNRVITVILCAAYLASPSLAQDKHYWTALESKDAMSLAKKKDSVFWINPDHNGMTPLMWAAWYSQDRKVIRELIKAGSIVNQRDLYTSSGKSDQEYTALLYAAARNNKPEVVRELILGGAALNYKDMSGQTALSIACASNNESVIRELLKWNPRVGDWEINYLENNDLLSQSEAEVLAKEISTIHKSQSKLSELMINDERVVRFGKTSIFVYQLIPLSKPSGTITLHSINGGKVTSVKSIVFKEMGSPGTLAIWNSDKEIKISGAFDCKELSIEEGGLRVKNGFKGWRTEWPKGKPPSIRSNPGGLEKSILYFTNAKEKTGFTELTNLSEILEGSIRVPKAQIYLISVKLISSSSP